MSGEALGWAKKRRLSQPDARGVLMMLADGANDEGFTWPKIATIAGWAQKSDRQVQRWLRSLADDGHLVVCTILRPSGATLGHAYWFPIEDTYPSPEQLRSLEEKFATAVHVRVSKSGGNGAGGGDTHVTGGVTPMSPLYGRKHLKEPSAPSERAPRGAPEDGESAANRQAWRALRAALADDLGKRRAGRFVAGLLKRFGLPASALADALQEARRNGTRDLAGWLTKAAQAEAAKRQRPTALEASADPATWTSEHWRFALEIAAERGRWPADFGPAPGQHDCLVPADLLSKILSPE